MQDISPLCSICFQEYNLNDRMARVIPVCGHSLCSKCITDIISLRPDFTCPFDMKKFDLPSKSLDSFPVNFAIKDLLEGESSYKLCEEHGLRKRLICSNDRSMVCEDCVFDGNHIGHKIYQLKKVKSIAQQKIVKCTAALNKIQEWEAKFLPIFEEEKTLMENVGKLFKMVRLSINKKETEIYGQIKSYFEFEKKEMKSCIGDDSFIKKSIKQATVCLQDVINGKNVLKVFQDSSDNFTTLNENVFQKQLNEMSQRLQKLKVTIEEPFVAMLKTIKGFNLSFSAPLCPKSEEKLQKSSSEAFLKPEFCHLKSPEDDILLENCSKTPLILRLD